MIISGIIAITMTLATTPVEPTYNQIEVQEVTQEVRQDRWKPYESCEMDADVQLLIHEVVEESFPELNETVVMALVYYESNGQMIYAKSGSGAYGYCQLKPSLFYERAEELGVSAYTEYGNIYLCADWLVSNCEKYGDIAYVLDLYRGGKKNADKWNKKRQLSPYAQHILELSDKMQNEVR